MQPSAMPLTCTTGALILRFVGPANVGCCITVVFHQLSLTAIYYEDKQAYTFWKCGSVCENKSWRKLNQILIELSLWRSAE
jgi:hypothetical protein